MSSVMIDSPRGEPGIESIGRDRLRQAAYLAADRAAASGHPIVASVILPVAPVDALAAFVAAGTDAAYYLEQPERHRAIVALGGAAAIAADGEASMATAVARWRELIRDAVTLPDGDMSAAITPGPLMLGGFAFDPHMDRTPLWQGFPDALLLLPRMLLQIAGDHAALTLNLLVHTAADVRQADALSIIAARWLATAILAQLRRSDGSASPLSPERAFTHRDHRSAAAWQDLVASTAAAIRAGHYEKVVLARSVQVEAVAPIVPAEVLERLRAAFPGAATFAIPRGDQFFVGATPEQLARVDDGKFMTMALAGTAPRGATADEDYALGGAMLRDAKLAREHATVITSLIVDLGPHFMELTVDPTPQIAKLANVQHLRTRLNGKLRTGRSVLDLVGDLHPTPAVGGLPRATALELIRAMEGLDRGWYAGPIGWVAPDGDGEFFVALRSGLIAGDRATLFAGCGIVGASDPAAEYEESRLKLQAMLHGLGMEA